MIITRKQIDAFMFMYAQTVCIKTAETLFCVCFIEEQIQCQKKKIIYSTNSIILQNSDKKSLRNQGTL